MPDNQDDRDVNRSDELETFRTEYRSLIGRAIVSGLINPHPGGLGGLGGILIAFGKDYDQNTGNYKQVGSGNHQQNSGNYDQSP